MNFSDILNLGCSAFEQGAILSLTVLALFLSYSMLNVCDLSTDGCFTLGAVVGLMAAKTAGPYLSLCAALLAGMVSGFVVAILQTKCGVNSLLAGIIVNTGLYSVNMTVMKGKPNVSIVKNETVFTKANTLFSGTFLEGYSDLLVLLLFDGIAFLLLFLFLRTRTGLSVRATGNNPDMVRSSSIDPALTTTVGLVLSNSLTALSGCLLAQFNKSADVNIGTGMVTIALAALLIGHSYLGKKCMALRLLGMILGAFTFYLVYTVALRFDIPAYMLKLVSAAIVFIAISAPYVKGKIPLIKRRLSKGDPADA